MALGIVQFWTDSGIQIVVLLSFAFQLFLFFGAGIRRRKASPVLKLLLWLVYLLADSTAIYALGHMSYTSPSQKHQLVAFWAPLLLVHLGGPDSITAYAIEDSRLWLRHLLTLVVQTLGASYVLYKYVVSASSTSSLLQAASYLMFTVGVLKYGERTWALRCGSMDGVKSRVISGYGMSVEDYYLLQSTVRRNLLNRPKHENDEELLLLAHFLLRICTDTFAGGGDDFWAAGCTHEQYDLQGDDMYKLVQMQLSLMYDMMYTKAWVIHTWYGYCISAVSLVATITSMLLFSFSDKNGYSSVDVGVTYFLLAGAVFLEIISALAAIGSTWMYAWLWSFKTTSMFANGLIYLRRRVGAANKRRCLISIGQYNLLHFCCRDHSIEKRLRRMGLDYWWRRVHFVCTADVAETHLLALLMKTLPTLGTRDSRGIHILERSGLGQEQAGWCHWSLNLDFEQSILTWHLATDVYLIRSKKVGHQGDLAKSVRMLSNYMMFLLVTNPDMLPGYVDEKLHDDLCRRMEHLAYNWNGNEESPKKWWDVLNNLFHDDGPNGSRIPQIEQLAQTFMTRSGDEIVRARDPRRFPEYVARHAAELLHLDSKKPDLLEVIFRVWLQMLVYAAHRCGPESHASQLSRGGEFITVLWILAQHFHSGTWFHTRDVLPPRDQPDSSNRRRAGGRV